MVVRSGLQGMAAALVMLLAATPAWADWTGKGEAGVALANGNSDTQTANARVAATHKGGGFENSFTFAWLYARNQNETIARRWEGGTQVRQNFFRNNFWYGGLRYEEDPFSGFDHQGLATIGIGRRFVESERTKLLLQVGAGYKFWKTQFDPVPGSEARKDNSVTGVSSLEFEHKLTDTTTLQNRFSGEFSSGNNFLQNQTGVAVKMTDRLALSLAYAVRHNTNPPERFKKTDTLTTANLVYEVK